jgi:hypothetical protein
MLGRDPAPGTGAVTEAILRLNAPAGMVGIDPSAAYAVATW